MVKLDFMCTGNPTPKTEFAEPKSIFAFVREKNTI